MALMVLTAGPVFSQRYVQGRVVDAATSTPLAGVVVKMWKVDFETTTGPDGAFELFFPNAGPMKYTLEYEGYRKATIKPKVGENRTITLEKKVKKVRTDTLPPPAPVPVRFGSEVTLPADSSKLLGIQHAAQLLQGQAAGLMVSRPGGNPNEDYLLRLRGLSTFTAQTAPLIVVDGLPETSLYLLDPSDIASIRVMKDAASTASYGIRGASGVIEVETKKINPGKPKVAYHGFVSQDFVAKTIPVASPEEFVNNGGGDFNERTDWVSEITRTPVSHGHHLSLTGGGMLGYAATLGYRNTRGILKYSGFEQMNGRLRLRFEPWKDRLDFDVRFFGTARQSEFSFPEAFRHAIQFNPTAPARSDDTAFEPFGGFFETQTFDAANPVAILEQNRNIGSWEQYGGRAGVAFAIFKNLKISGFYTRQESERWGGRFLSPQSIYQRAIARMGSLGQFVDTRSNQFARTSLSGDFYLKKTGLKIEHRHGLDWQRHEYESTSWQADSVGQVNLNFDNLDENLTGAPLVSRFGGVRNVRAWFSEWELQWRQFFVGGKLRREGTNFQETVFKNGLFYGLTGGVQLGELLSAKHYDAVLRVGYGKVGGLFAEVNPHISRNFFGREEQPLLTNSEFLPGQYFAGNLNFQWEGKREWNVGADFSLSWSGLQGSLDFYKNTADGLMILEPFFVAGVYGFYKPHNHGELINSGFELSLSMDLLKNENLTWRTLFIFFTCKTTVKKFSLTESERWMWLDSGYPGPGHPPAIRLMENERLGELFGAVFIGVDEFGFPIFEDLDNSGFGSRFEDIKVLGHALPTFSIGWQHSLTWQKFDLTASFRGAFGHSLVNSHRMYRENTGFLFSNFVKTDKFIPELLFNGGFSDRSVEDASFIRLDYVALGRQIELKKGDCRVYLAAQNLFTLTGYLGADPEPRLEIFADPLEFGVENGNTYYRSQTLTAGVQLSF